MRGTQRIVSVVIGLVLVVGGYGCRYLAREATDDAADRITQDAIDDAYRWQPPTTTAPDVEVPTVPVTTPEVAVTTTTGPAPEDDAALPEGWPAGLVLVDGLAVQSTSDVAGLGVTGHVKGELVAVTEAVRADLAEAGLAVDTAGTTDPAVGGGGSVTRATGPTATATVLISPVPEQPGTLLVSYRLQPTAG